MEFIPSSRFLYYYVWGESGRAILNETENYYL